MPYSEGISESELTVDLRRRITELETQLSSVESEKRALEEKIEALEMKGAYDPAATKVLTLRDNPFANTQENLFTEVTNLRQDNERFRQRIKVLEDCISRLRQVKSEQAQSAYVDEPTVGLGSVTMLVNDRLKDNPDPLTELAEVREQLRVEQSRSDRLMEMFHKASAKYRAYCRDLLGYRVDVSSSDECKIRSVFASDANEFILFRRNSDNALELVDNHYTRALPNEVRSFVEAQRNIPGFFAALTLSYLHQDTMLM
ncbi:unnamed protein product [Dicrocoelium dendriticum]|nr:unnamed protein product [Dicrocoelium dendriticum]